jgi:hypothetical protein
MSHLFWFISLMLVLVWYIVVTFIVAKRGFGSLRTILQELTDEREV